VPATLPRGVLAMTLMTSNSTYKNIRQYRSDADLSLTSAAAMVVYKYERVRRLSKESRSRLYLTSSAFVSYAGATSTRSAETIFKPSRPLKIVRSSRVDQPPVSGVPVAGANAGSMESIFGKDQDQKGYEKQSKCCSHRLKDKPACHPRFFGSFR
jgi:hypothetical protein